MALAFSVFATAWSALFVRWAGVPAMTAGFCRLLLASAVLWPALSLRSRGPRMPRRSLKWALLSGVAWSAVTAHRQPRLRHTAAARYAKQAMFPALRMLFVYLVLGVPASVVGITWSLLRRNFRTMYAWGMGILRLGLRAAGIGVRVVGHENVPARQACIFMSNHVSNLDPPVLLPMIPGMTAVFLKKELMRIPLLGTAMRMGKFVPVTRGHSRDDAIRSVQAAKEALAAGLHITVFPEGTRSPDGNLLPFKKGAFFLAAETGAPLVPVVIYGTAAMMPKGTLRIAPAEAVVRFLPAVVSTEFTSREDLMQAVRERMESALTDGLPT